jgi:hypothetical protein
MSNPIKVTFAKEFYLSSLILHPDFSSFFGNLNPEVDGLSIKFYDSVTGHNALDSEETILKSIADFLLGIDKTTFEGKVEFLNSFGNRQKGGFKIGDNVIVNSTDISRH